MSDGTIRRRREAFSLAVLIAAFAGCAASGLRTILDVPSSLRVLPFPVSSSQVHASSVRIYESRPSKNDPTLLEWVFRAPEADLLDRTGKPIGKHDAGPT